MTPIRVTSERDGDLISRGYATLSQAWVGTDGTIYCFVGHADGRPRFFRIMGGVSEPFEAHMPYGGTADGWYWDAEGKIYLPVGPQLHRVDPFTGEDQIVFDISQWQPDGRLWQVHSSDDGQTHSATVQRIVSDGPYPNIATVVYRNGRPEFYPAIGKLDESQVTSCGGYLVIKENDDNRIVTLATGEQRIIPDAMGAAGHSDCGPGFIAGEDNHRGAIVKWDFGSDLTVPIVLFSPTWNMGHLSIRKGLCLWTDRTKLRLLDLDGSGTVTPLVEHGMVIHDQNQAYDYQPNGNLSPCGRVVFYMSNIYGRMDAFILDLRGA